MEANTHQNLRVNSIVCARTAWRPSVPWKNVGRPGVLRKIKRTQGLVEYPDDEFRLIPLWLLIEIPDGTIGHGVFEAICLRENRVPEESAMALGFEATTV